MDQAELNQGVYLGVRDAISEILRNDFFYGNLETNLFALADRRERIATAAVQGECANPNVPWNATPDEFADKALAIADALIAKLDRTVE